MPPTIDSAAPRVAVVGGGISGLAAAHRLTELLPQAELALFEAAGRLGGILDTVRRDGFLLERSADSFQTKLPHAVDLCRRLGIADQLLPTDDARRRAMVVCHGQLLPVPPGFYLMSPGCLGPLLGTRILSWPGKLRLLMEPLVPPAPTLIAERGTNQSLHDESIASFVTRRLGREAFDRLVQPLVAGIYTGDAARLSMAATLPEFLNYERRQSSLLRATLKQRKENPFGGQRDAASHDSDEMRQASGARYSLFAAPQDGIAALIKAVSDRLPPNSVRLNTQVNNIKRAENNRWHVECATVGPQSAIGNPELTFDALIVAAPAHSAAKILRSCAPDLSDALAEIEYTSCAIVSLACRRGQITHPLDSFGFVVPRIENRRIIAASFASQKFPGRAPDGCVLIRAFLGGAHQPELVDLPDADLEQLARLELADLLDLRGEPLWVDIARWRRSMPQYHVGHLGRVAHIETLTQRLPTLALAGSAYHGVGIPQCIHNGEQAAESVTKQLLS
jgi:oxygen-dependent protoporphyrinogen oxidase